MKISEALTFDDILLMPAKSSVLPGEVDLQTRFSRNIPLNIPLASAAMDTVTEARLAIALAGQGGIGIVHRNLSIEAQVAEVEKVKRSESGMIVDPVTMQPKDRIRDVLEVMDHHKISGVPITDTKGKLFGILTNRDLRFETDLDLPVSQLMTKDNLVTVRQGISMEKAKKKLHEHRIEKLLVVDKENRLKGLITVKDIMKVITYPNAAKDSYGRPAGGSSRGCYRRFFGAGH